MDSAELAEIVKPKKVYFGPEKLVIERLDRSQFHARGNGYRFHDEWEYAFYDVYWNKVSEHYLIQEAYRLKQHNMRLGIKPLTGPFSLEILEPETSEETVDRKCLEHLLGVIKRHYPEINIDIRGNFDLLEIKKTG